MEMEATGSSSYQQGGIFECIESYLVQLDSFAGKSILERMGVI
jgi:hypothetical protein